MSVKHLIWILLSLMAINLSLARPQGMCKWTDGPIKNKNNTKLEERPTVCENMAPGGGLYPAETSSPPWTIYTYRTTIQQNHIQPVTIGSSDETQVFSGFVIAAKTFHGSQVGDLIGNFMYQWDSIPICCENHGANEPDMLKSSQSRVKKTNQTLLWAAPNNYEGPFVFIASVWKSSRKYWIIRSPVIKVIK